MSLLTACERLKARAEETLAQPRQTNTRRRVEQAAGIEARAMREIARAELGFRIVAEGDRGELGALAKVRTIKHLERLEYDLAHGRARAAMGTYKHHEAITDEEAIAAARRIESPEDERIYKALGIKTNQDLRDALRVLVALRAPKRAEDPVKAIERKLVGARIPGYFPTARDVAARMAELVGAAKGRTILEPSAGCGRLADACRDRGADVLCLEINHTLVSLLEAKGHTASQVDFMDEDLVNAWTINGNGALSQQFHGACMNPPFEDGADMRHVMRARSLILSPWPVVAIMSEGPFFRSDRAAVEFRAWLATRTVDVNEELPPGTFNHADVTQRTNVRARLLRIL